MCITVNKNEILNGTVTEKLYTTFLKKITSSRWLSKANIKFEKIKLGHEKTSKVFSELYLVNL